MNLIFFILEAKRSQVKNDRSRPINSILVLLYKQLENRPGRVYLAGAAVDELSMSKPFFIYAKLSYTNPPVLTLECSIIAGMTARPKEMQSSC